MAYEFTDILVSLQEKQTMTNLADLKIRAGNTCELCGTTDDLAVQLVAPREEEGALLCAKCRTELAADSLDATHWHCLNDSMWSEVPAVQVLVWRLLKRLRKNDQLDMLYLDEDTRSWAETVADAAVVHKDSNGHVLSAGDSVVLIQDLKVKGANFTAKRGTAVRRISLVQDNPEHIEGRVDGQHIVILTKYVKKK